MENKNEIYLFRIFNESKDNDHIAAILTYSNRKALFFQKNVDF